jgi:hypothetical protein
MNLILYTKDDCPLCDRLIELVEPFIGDAVIEKRDITTDEDWNELYRYRIPVLTRDGRIILEGRPDQADVERAFANQ